MPVGGNETVKPTETTTYTLSCDGPKGSATADATIVVVPPPTIAGFAAAPQSVAAGSAATLSWDAGNADYCIWSDALAGQTHPRGSRSVKPAKTIAYSVACFGVGGRTERQTIAVTVPGTVQIPTAYIEGIPKRISRSRGDSSTLSWEGQASDGCIGTGFDTQTQAKGTVAVQPAISTIYSVTCKGAGGTSATRTSQVIVDP